MQLRGYLAVVALASVGCAAPFGGLSAQEITVETLDPLAQPVNPSVGALNETIDQEDATIGTRATLRGLDKVNGHTQDAELPVGGSARIFGVMATLHECRYPTENPTGDAYAFLTLRDPKSGVTLFEGWMIASSPALNALDHRRYDVWVLRCKSV